MIIKLIILISNKVLIDKIRTLPVIFIIDEKLFLKRPV